MQRTEGPTVGDSRPLIFLDIDGVINRCAESGFGLEDEKLRLLWCIADETDCLLVLSSSWRESPDQLLRLRIALEHRGMVLHSHTPILTTTPDGCRIARAKPRFEEIQAWRDDHPEHTGNFVILDDEPDFGPLNPHHVRTRSDTGLTELLVKEVIERLNKPHP
jgi:hypothetical protein